jgi:hypothetical protein
MARCVGRALSRWSQFFPVAESAINVSQIDLPGRLDQLSQEHWQLAFEAAQNVHDESSLGDFYAQASVFQASPDKILCRCAEVFEMRSPGDITAATHQSERDALVREGCGVVLVETAEAASGLIERWGLQPASLSVATEVIPVSSGAENALVVEYPPLRGCSSHIEEFALGSKRDINMVQKIADIDGARAVSN